MVLKSKNQVSLLIMPVDKYNKAVAYHHEDNDESTYTNEIYCYPFSIDSPSESDHYSHEAITTRKHLQVEQSETSILKNIKSTHEPKKYENKKIRTYFDFNFYFLRLKMFKIKQSKKTK